MPLLDHFRPPIQDDWPWRGIHSDWASSIVRQLNRKPLPEEYVALPHVYFGGHMEIDVATTVWVPARPRLDCAVDFVDLESVEVQVFHQMGGLRLVAVVELVSPAHKDREVHWQAFAFRCAAYLQQGVSVVVVDVVTTHTKSLHRELLALLKLAGECKAYEIPDLYAVAYRSFTADRQGRLQLWEEPLAIGRTLPTLPLWIAPDLVVPVDLESSYRETCEGLRIRL